MLTLPISTFRIIIWILSAYSLSQFSFLEMITKSIFIFWNSVQNPAWFENKPVFSVEARK